MPEFVIPISKNDLLKCSINSYQVEEVLSLRNIKVHFTNCQNALKNSGHTYIVKAFDVLFTILHEWSNVDYRLKEDAWQIVLQGCETCVRQLAAIVEAKNEAGQLRADKDFLSLHRNSLKMHVYLLCQFVESFENDNNANLASTGLKIGKGTSKRGKKSASLGRNMCGLNKFSIDWPRECDQAMVAIDQLCRLQLNKLWDPPIAEEDFVNIMANSCYKLLENQDLISSANIRFSITRILASLVRLYGHSITCCVKLAQMLQCYPHMGSCLLAILRGFIEEENLASTVRELLKEICSYSSADLERDSQATHHFSNFLIEVAAQYPVMAQSILPLLRPRLDEDPYQMRNCALTVIGEVLRGFARREQLDAKDRMQRDKLLDLLQVEIAFLWLLIPVLLVFECQQD